MNDGQPISEESARGFSDKKVFYCRLNVQHGLEGIGFGDSERLGDVRTHTEKYLESYDVTRKVAQLVQVLNWRIESKKTHVINQNVGNLNLAPFAAYDSSEVAEKVSCFKGTRIGLLSEIATWMAGDDHLPPIYVLDGVAGIGKSTVAKTVAEHAAERNLLGASFFFSRNDDKRKTAKTFIPTIAYQLAYYNEDFAEQINEALLRTPHVVTLPPQKQFSTLIMDPLKGASAPVLIVIDALDECEHGGDALLKIFADSMETMPQLKLFVTTRPEHHIRTVLDRYHHLKRFRLQDIEASLVQSDIQLYLDFHLSEKQIRERLPDPKRTWKPTRSDMKVLVGICGTLFILASTAVKFILDSKRSDPARQLSRLLQGVSHQDFSGSKHTTAMDSLYTQILLSAVPDDGDDCSDWFRHYQIVIGSIVALQYPLRCVALSSLLGIDCDDVIRMLSHLYSLVAPTGQDLTYQIHHKSFPDFVTSSSRCESRFLIDLRTCHLQLGKQCLKFMDSHLERNICKLGPTDRFKDNNDIQHLTQSRIVQELAYASTHWATHLAKGLQRDAKELDADVEKLLEGFAHKHLLVWLEVLSFIGQIETAYWSLDAISKLLDRSKSVVAIALREIFHDGCRFIAWNMEIIKVSASHISSALAFGPKYTKLYETYGGSENFAVITGYGRKWIPTISVMAEHTGRVTSLAFSGDGLKLASASGDRTVRLWDCQTGGEIVVLRGHSDSVNSIVFSPDGNNLASASHDRTVRVWDGQTGAELAVLHGHSKWINSVVFSPDGTKLVSASGDGTGRLWDTHTRAEIAVLRGHSDAVNAVLFSPDSTRLASASDDKTLRLWDGQTGAEITVLRGHLQCVHCVVFSPDGKALASASDEETIRLWDGKTGAEITILRGHSKWVKSVTFSPDGRKLASASGDTTIRLWNVQTGAELAVLKGHSTWVKSVVFSFDGTKLASASDDRTVRLWDTKIFTEVAVLRGHSDWVNSVVFSPDGMRLASTSDDNTVLLWDGQVGAGVTAFQEDSDWVEVNLVTFSPDGTKLASASADGTMRLWDGRTGTEITVLRGHSTSVSALVFSPFGKLLASASNDETVRLWDGQTGAKLAVLEGHSHWVNSVVFSLDGTKLASVPYDTIVWLWDTQTFRRLAILLGHLGWINSVVFSPDGKTLASASDDLTVRLWDSQSGTTVAVLQGHTECVDSVVFSPDGTTLASVSRSGTVRLWNRQTGTEVANFIGSGLISFTLDSSRLLSMGPEGLYQVNCITGDKLALYGTFVHSFVDGVRVPGSNMWVILVDRKQPSLQGLSVVRVDNEGTLRFTSLCWFPPNLSAI